MASVEGYRLYVEITKDWPYYSLHYILSYYTPAVLAEPMLTRMVADLHRVHGISRRIIKIYV